MISRDTGPLFILKKVFATCPFPIQQFATRNGKDRTIFFCSVSWSRTLMQKLYISSVLKLLKTFRVKKYILLGSMYDTVPHTRPLLVSGYGMGEKAVQDLKKAGILPITYHGPSSIANLITKEAAESGIEVIVLIVSLPHYVVLEEDYLGKLRLMEVLNTLYNIPVAKEDFEKALEQRDRINERLENSPEVKILLPQLENVYDTRIKTMEKEGVPSLTPEMEELFWKITGKDIGRA